MINSTISCCRSGGSRRKSQSEKWHLQPTTHTEYIYRDEINIDQGLGSNDFSGYITGESGYRIKKLKYIFEEVDIHFKILNHGTCHHRMRSAPRTRTP